MPKVNLTIDTDKKTWKDAYDQAIVDIGDDIGDLQTGQGANLDSISKLETTLKGLMAIVERDLIRQRKTLRLLRSRI